MDSTQILIVEDDMIIATDISLHLTRLGYEVVGIVTRGEGAIKQIQEDPPDIVLMDIQLKGQIDGIETTRRIQELNDEIIIIFLTANIDDATYNEAKTTRPHAFLAKPFKKMALGRAIELALLRKEETTNNTKTNASSAEEMPNSFILTDRIFVKYRDKMIKIFVEDILFVEAERNYCKIFTATKEHLMTLPLKSFEEKLSSKNFVRIHRSYIINLTKVDALSDNCNYVTIGSKTLPVSKSNKEHLINRFKMI